MQPRLRANGGNVGVALVFRSCTVTFELSDIHFDVQSGIPILNNLVEYKTCAPRLRTQPKRLLIVLSQAIQLDALLAKHRHSMQ